MTAGLQKAWETFGRGSGPVGRPGHNQPVDVESHAPPTPCLPSGRATRRTTWPATEPPDPFDETAANAYKIGYVR